MGKDKKVATQLQGFMYEFAQEMGLSLRAAKNKVKSRLNNKR